VLKQKGVRQKTLAKALGVEPPIISRWLKGPETPSATRLFEIADVLNVTLDELIGRGSLSGGPMPQIRKHAQLIYTLAGGVQASPKKKRKKKSKGKRA
jgi:transcriptional regulator with XRE-family HTH domain